MIRLHLLPWMLQFNFVLCISFHTKNDNEFICSYIQSVFVIEELAIVDFTINLKHLTSSRNEEIVILSKCQRNLSTIPPEFQAPECRQQNIFLFSFSFSELSCCVVRSTSVFSCCCLCCFYFFLLFHVHNDVGAILWWLFSSLNLSFFFFFSTKEYSPKKGQHKMKTEDLEISWFNLESPTT